MGTLTRMTLQRVHYMPKELQPGTLYVSEAFGAALHVCPCGCGSRISTPLSPTQWHLDDTLDGPSLYPSVGNWQIPCCSHYWIDKGQVKWAEPWTPKQVAAGRHREETRTRAYYARRRWSRILSTIWTDLKALLRR